MKKDSIPIKIREAMSIQAKYHETAVLDTSRPVHHFVSPANRLIDVWGGIYHNGKYHLFYDTNHDNEPEKQGGTFGHICSEDLVTWEHLPFALLPETQKGEKQLNDGIVVIDPAGKPLMYYTRCFYDTKRNREHVAVRGSDDLLVWERLNDGKAILTMENHGGPQFHMSWSDVVIFNDSGKTFMIISKCTSPETGGMIPIYEAVDDTWLKWKYKGIFAEHTGEVINFTKIKDKWVLIYSPYANPKYFVGSFDAESGRFTAENEGILSYGYVRQGSYDDISRGFYATSLYVNADKPYITGWISGFHEPKGWDGGISFTRVLDLDENNNLLMRPIPQLEKLRKSKIELNYDEPVNCPRSFELDMEFEIEINDEMIISIQDSFELTVSRNKVVFNDIEFEYSFEKQIKIQMYIDVTIAEIFFDDGKISLTRCFPEIKNGTSLNINSNAKLNKCDLYSI